MKRPHTLTPVFEGSNIVLPFREPLLLKGTKEDGNYAFIFRYDGDKFYIFVTLKEGVINHNLPGVLGQQSKQFLIDTVNHYCEKSRNGLADNLFLLKQNALRLRSASNNLNITDDQ